ncbi:kynureninase [Devosia sp. ZB163]|uniref:kynureninase n=1 Tax=Devosia sp. ZB163 TaxID=3025938 RepID=UPI002361A737|nr:kynureninase [Devosia sp. ZB163]MDC9826397.1 kynureninase [Devosia sp. ZB163]
MTHPTAAATATFSRTRDLFDLPEGVIYLDGNSLGALPRGVKARMAEVVATQWGEGLIRSWNTHDWIDLPGRVGNRVARLIGAAPGTVTVADSTSINLFKVLVTALRLRPGRKVILSEKHNFPTDAYIAAGVAELLGAGHELRLVEAAELSGAIDEDVAVLMLTEVNYRTGARHDMAALTRAAQAAGALTIWDLCHSAGAVPVDLGGAGADFAVGCGYKYLNGGPGAPAFVYVAPDHLEGLSQPLTGWLGHAAPFSFAETYRPAEGIAAMRVGTPPILSMSALDAALDVFEGVDLGEVKAQADRLFERFTGIVAEEAPELVLATPVDPSKRGTQVSLRHPEAYAVMQALIARGVIGDFREPDIMRFGLTPLYVGLDDVERAARILGEVIRAGAWDRPEFRQRAKVV